jgi:hypothetical protein
MARSQLDLFDELTVSCKHHKAAAFIESDKQAAILVDAQAIGQSLVRRVSRWSTQTYLPVDFVSVNHRRA